MDNNLQVTREYSARLRKIVEGYRYLLEDSQSNYRPGFYKARQGFSDLQKDLKILGKCKPCYGLGSLFGMADLINSYKEFEYRENAEGIIRKHNSLLIDLPAPERCGAELSISA